MKTKIVIFILFVLLAASCAPATPISAPTDPSAQRTQPPATQEPIVTEAVATDAPTPTSTPLACVALLMPENGANLPATGKVTFSWLLMDGAKSYILNIILPSSETVTFETDQTTYNRYMEAFTAGGKYQWQVTAQGADGSEICISEAFAFDKPEYQKPAIGGGGGGNPDTGAGGGGGPGPGGGGGTPQPGGG